MEILRSQIQAPRVNFVCKSRMPVVSNTPRSERMLKLPTLSMKCPPRSDQPVRCSVSQALPDQPLPSAGKALAPAEQDGTLLVIVSPLADSVQARSGLVLPRHKHSSSDRTTRSALDSHRPATSGLTHRHLKPYST